MIDLAVFKSLRVSLSVHCGIEWFLDLFGRGEMSGAHKSKTNERVPDQEKCHLKQVLGNVLFGFSLIPCGFEKLLCHFQEKF